MRSAEEILVQVKDTIADGVYKHSSISGVDYTIAVAAMKEYAKEVAVEYGKFLGLRGTSWRGTPEDDQWEWIDKAGELNYNGTESLYDIFISNDPKYRI